MALPRTHLFEFEDLAWCPQIVRDYGTDYLQHVQHAMKLHAPMVPLLSALLRSTGDRRIVDLCSGGGGPIVAITRELRADDLPVEVLLTDRFPSRTLVARFPEASVGPLAFHAEAVDARSVPRELDGTRTIFNAFHHFAPDDARAVLQDAVEAGRPIAVFELQERTLPVILLTCLAPFMMLLTTPFIRPFRWRRLVLTYLLPLLPIVCLWDGVVSQLRAYTPDELRFMATSVTPSAEYEWEAGTANVAGLPSHLTYLLGRPR